MLVSADVRNLENSKRTREVDTVSAMSTRSYTIDYDGSMTGDPFGPRYQLSVRATYGRAKVIHCRFRADFGEADQQLVARIQSALNRANFPSKWSSHYLPRRSNRYQWVSNPLDRVASAEVERARLIVQRLTLRYRGMIGGRTPACSRKRVVREGRALG